jgi:hypothetical protein
MEMKTAITVVTSLFFMGALGLAGCGEHRDHVVVERERSPVIVERERAPVVIERHDEPRSEVKVEVERR